MAEALAFAAVLEQVMPEPYQRIIGALEKIN